MSINVFLLVILQIAPFFLVLISFFIFLPPDLPPDLMKVAILMPILLISVGFAVLLLFFGIKKLNRLE